MGIGETRVQEIVRRMLTVAIPDKTVLFGSVAMGAMIRDGMLKTFKGAQSR